MAQSSKVANIVIPVSDLDAAKAMYGALWGDPHTDTPYYVGYNVGGFEIGLNPNGDVSCGPVAHHGVDNVEAAEQALLAAGATHLTGPLEVAPGIRIVVVADPSGNPVGLIGG